MATLEQRCKNGETVAVDVGDDLAVSVERFKQAVEAAGGAEEPPPVKREPGEFTMNEQVFMALCRMPPSPPQEICQAMIGAAEPVNCDRLLMRMLLAAEKPALQYAAVRLGENVARQIAAARPQLRRVA